MYEVLKQFELAGHTVKVGDVVQLAPVQATFCINAGLVQLRKDAVAPVSAARATTKSATKTSSSVKACK